MTKITENLKLVRQRIDDAAVAAGRDPAGIRLLAVSKQHTVSAISEAASAGQRHFGESYVQEALDKIETLAGLDIRWHFIGALQSNKTGPVARNFDWVHSVSRISIARRLDKQRPPGLRPLQVCIQVRIGDETSKSGAGRDEIPALAAEIAELPGLRLRGLMCLPPPSSDTSVQRGNFAALRACFESLRELGHELDTLSMGMSADLEAAVAEGSTCVRIGTAIFGPRH